MFCKSILAWLYLAIGMVATTTLAVSAHAQSAGTIRGTVKDASGAAVPGARVSITNPLHGHEHGTTTRDDGTFVMFGIGFNVYTLAVDKEGFAPYRQNIELRSEVPLEVNIELQVAGVQATVEVKEQILEVSSTSTHVDVHYEQISRQPGAVPSRQIESVLLATPGVVADDNGRIHARGGHYQTSFLIDGLPVSDQLSIVFSNPFDVRNVQAMEVYTGNFPAEFGNKLSAVVNVSTKSGIGSGRRAFGGVGLSGGSFNTGEVSVEVGGGSDRWGYYLSSSGNVSKRFLDAPDPRNFHNGGDGQSQFVRLDFFPSQRDIFRLSMNSGRSSYQVPNLASQQANGQDQRQRLTDYAVRLTWIHTFTQQWALEATPYYRLAVAQLYPSAGDTPVTATQSRRLVTAGGRAAFSYLGRGHRLKTGFDFFGFPVLERFSFGITNPAFNDPLDPDYNPNLAPYDLTRGGTRFSFDRSRTGQQYSFYVQDTYTWKGLTVAGGIRVDAYRFVVDSTHVSPRFGLAYNFPRTSTVLRFSYNRLFQTPSNENLLLSSAPEAAQLVPPDRLAIIGTALVLVRPERDDLYEVGLAQGVNGWFRFDASYFRKNIRDFHDNDQFLNTTVVFPIAFSGGQIDGFDFRIEMPAHKGLSGYWNFAVARALAHPPLSGGLFLGEEAIELFDASEEVRPDHDQKFTSQWALTYEHHDTGIWTSVLGRYDSGLPTEIEDVAAVAADPDVSAGLPLVDLTADPIRVKGRLVWDWSLGKEFYRDRPYRITCQFDILNLTNQKRLYNFLSVFSGTHYIPPRTYAGRMKFRF